jgi:hypothetical protein
MMTFACDPEAILLELAIRIIIGSDGKDLDVAVSEDVLALTVDEIVWFSDSLKDAMDSEPDLNCVCGCRGAGLQGWR